jgi:hypothetical protein
LGQAKNVSKSKRLWDGNLAHEFEAEPHAGQLKRAHDDGNHVAA